MIYGIWSWVHALERDTNTGQWHKNISLREYVVFLQRAIHVSIYCVQCIINIMESAYGVTSSLSHQKTWEATIVFSLRVCVSISSGARAPPLPFERDVMPKFNWHLKRNAILAQSQPQRYSKNRTKMLTTNQNECAPSLKNSSNQLMAKAQSAGRSWGVSGNSDIVDDIYVLNGNQFAMVVCWGGWRRNGAIPY